MSGCNVKDGNHHEASHKVNSERCVLRRSKSHEVWWPETPGSTSSREPSWAKRVSFSDTPAFVIYSDIIYQCI